MQSSARINNPTIVHTLVPPDGVDFAAQFRTRQNAKKSAHSVLVEAKAKEAKQKEKGKNIQRPTQLRITQRYDPCAQATRAEVKALNDYAKRQPGYPIRKVNTSLQWYYHLRTPQEWLHDTQIDAGIDLLRYRQREHPEWFRSERLTFIDTVMFKLWVKHFPDWVADGPDLLAKRMPPNVWDWHCGKLPAYCQTNKTWGIEIDHIYSALFVGGNHWVACMISIPDRHITIWDSILSSRTEERVGAAVAPICEIFPVVMHLLAPEDDKWNYLTDKYTHTIVRSPDLPQNVVTGDCGVYCLKFIEFHSLGMPFPKFLCDKNMKIFRDKLAADVLNILKRTGEEEPMDYDMLDIYTERKVPNLSQ